MAEPASPAPITYNVAELVDVDFFGYEPSLALGITALVLFLAAAVVVGVQVHRSAKKHKGYGRYMHLVTATGLTEAAGYAALVWLISKSGKTNIYGGYVAMQVFVILSPNLLQAADYSTVSKVSSFSGLHTHSRWLQPKLLTWGFILADILALLVQAVGISLWASSKGSGSPDSDLIALGSWVTVAGLAVQLSSFAVFTFLAIWVQRHPRNLLRDKSGHYRTFLCIYLTIALVSIRNIFRFVEFVQGAILTWPVAEDVYVISEKEVLFYTLDTLPILLCFATYILLNPAKLLGEYSSASLGDTTQALGSSETLATNEVSSVPDRTKFISHSDTAEVMVKV